MNSCSRVFRLASPCLARSISSTVRMGRVTLPEADWTDFMSCLRNHFWNWFVVSTQDLTLNQLWSWKMLWRIIDVCEASTSLRCLVGALLISKWLWRSMLRAWLYCGNKSQLLSFSQNERRFWRQKHVGNPTVTSDDPGIPLAYWGFAACCALWRGRRTRSGQKTLCLQHRKLHALSIKRMWLCYLPFLFGFFMLAWFLMTCSVFVKTEMQAFVLPKLYTCNRGISMQRDASQEDLMWKMTSKKTKRPPVKPFHSPIQVGYSNHRERCKPMRVTVNLWVLLLSYVHDILQSQKLHRSLVERQVDGTDCIWRAHTIEPCFGCCAKQLNATRPENPWTTFANDKAALPVSWCLRLLLNQVGWEKSMSNVSYSLPERVAVSKHLNCDLDLGAFSGNVSRCWNELEKKSWKEIWQHMKTKLRAAKSWIWRLWGIRLRRFGKCPLLENFRSLSAWRARLRSWRSWSCSLMFTALSNDFMFLWKVRCIYVHTTRICPCRDPLVWFVVLFQAKWSSLDEDDFVSFLQILDALLEALSFVVMHPIQASDTTQGLDPITVRCQLWAMQELLEGFRG